MLYNKFDLIINSYVEYAGFKKFVCQLVHRNIADKKQKEQYTI